jgi:hypothetical protein
MWKEENSFKECFEELKEIAGNIEGPLQKIIEDSAAQMDVCRRKIMPYAGTETGIFEPQTPKTESLETDTPLNSKPDQSEKNKVCKERVKLWNLCNPLVKLIGGAILSIIGGIVVTILSDVIMKTSNFEHLLNIDSELFRNDSNIISRVFIAKNDYLRKWNYRSIPKLKI